MNRKDILAAVKQSKQATSHLAMLLAHPPFDETLINAALNQGAQVSQVSVERSEEGLPSLAHKVWCVDQALKEGSLKLFTVLLDAAIEEKQFKKINKTLDQICVLGNVDAMRLCIDRQVLPKDSEVQTELMKWAVLRNQVDIVRLLLNEGFPAEFVVKTDYDDYNLLGYAPSLEMAELLIDHGADLHYIDQRNRPPLAGMINHFTVGAQSKYWGEQQQQLVLGMLARGSLVATEKDNDNPHCDWSLLKQLENERIEDSVLIRAAFDKDPTQRDRVRLKSIESLYGFFEAQIYENTEQFETAISWSNFEVWRYDQLKMQRLDGLLSQGVRGPRIEDVNPSYINQWLQFGIQSTEQAIDSIVYNSEAYDEDEGREYSRYDTSWADNMELIRQSDQKAKIRDDKNTLHANTPTVEKKKTSVRI